MLKLGEIKLVKAWASGLDIMREAKAITTILRLEALGPAIAGLGLVHTGGLGCDYEPGCPYVSLGLKRILEHFRGKY